MVVVAIKVAWAGRKYNATVFVSTQLRLLLQKFFELSKILCHLPLNLPLLRYLAGIFSNNLLTLGCTLVFCLLLKQ